MTGARKFQKYATQLAEALRLIKLGDAKNAGKALTILTNLKKHAEKLGGIGEDGEVKAKTPKARSVYQEYQKAPKNRAEAKRAIEARGEEANPKTMMREIAAMWKKSDEKKLADAMPKTKSSPKPKTMPAAITTQTSSPSPAKEKVVTEKKTRKPRAPKVR